MEISYRFGGIYSDGDNTLVSLDGLQDAFSRHGFAVHGRPDALDNSAVLAARQHPFPRRYLDAIGRNYALTQADLLSTALEMVETLAGAWLTLPQLRVHRNSVFSRTGTYVCGEVVFPVWAGATPDDVFQHVPVVTEAQITIGSATSWLPRSPLKPPRRYLTDQVAEVTRDVVATLIRELYNREGDLHLTYVAPVIAGLPEPYEAWRAVITFILSQPGLPPVTTVTDRILHRVDTDITVFVVDLPADLSAALGLSSVPSGQDPPGIWRRTELMRPVTLGTVGRAAARDSAEPGGPVPGSSAAAEATSDAQQADLPPRLRLREPSWGPESVAPDVGRPVGVEAVAGAAAAPGVPAGGGARTVEVRSDRWQPLRNALEYQPGDGGGRRRVIRPPGSGVRTEVSYQLTTKPKRWDFVVRVHLQRGDNVSAADLAQVERDVHAGVRRYFNDPGYTLPGVDRRLHVEVRFVDSPELAHATVTVTPAPSKPGSDGLLDQRSWPAGLPEAAYAHEIGHYLGVTHPPARQGASARQGAAARCAQSRRGQRGTGPPRSDGRHPQRASRRRVRAAGFGAGADC